MAVREEWEIIVRRTPFARATASIGRVSDMVEYEGPAGGEQARISYHNLRSAGQAKLTFGGGS